MSALPVSSLSAMAEAKTPPVRDESLMQAAQGLEAVFLNQMIQAMRQTVQKSDFIPQSQSERIFGSMLDSEYATQLAKSEQIGLSHLIYDHLLQASQR